MQHTAEVIRYFVVNRLSNSEEFCHEGKALVRVLCSNLDEAVTIRPLVFMPEANHMA